MRADSRVRSAKGQIRRKTLHSHGPRPPTRSQAQPPSSVSARDQARGTLDERTKAKVTCLKVSTLRDHALVESDRSRLQTRHQGGRMALMLWDQAHGGVLARGFGKISAFPPLSSISWRVKSRPAGALAADRRGAPMSFDLPRCRATSVGILSQGYRIQRGLPRWQRSSVFTEGSAWTR